MDSIFPNTPVAEQPVTIPVAPDVPYRPAKTKWVLGADRPLPFRPPAGMLDYGNVGQLRQYVLDKALSSLQSVKPVSNEAYQLEVADVKYTGADPTIDDEITAMKTGRSLTKRLTGQYLLKDKATGKVVSKSGRKTLMNVPWVTSDGYYVIRGVPYSFVTQFRMNPGIYTRTASDGVTEAQFNTAQGFGVPFRVRMDPKNGVFSMRIAGHNVPLYQMLSGMGVSDDALKEAWGKELFEANRTKKPHSSTVSWMKRLLETERSQQSKKDPEAAANAKDTDLLRSYFSRMQLDEENTQRLMGIPYPVVTPESILHASLRVLNVSAGKEEQDSRDNPSNQRVYDFGDHLATYLNLDRGGVFRGALWKLRNDPERLARIPSALFDQHIGHHLNNSGLAQVLDLINPLDAINQRFRITRLGEGAIENLDSAPDEARAVQPGYVGVIDPIKAPESLKVGLDMHLARTAVKGMDNRLYFRLYNSKTGKIDWVNPVQMESMFIGEPGATAGTDKYIAAMSPKYGFQWVPKKDVHYELVSGDDLFSNIADTIPIKSGVKGMRQLMGSKFVSGAVPLVEPDAPLVETPARDGRPASEFFGEAVGALRSPVSGTVISAGSRRMLIQGDNGEIVPVEYSDWKPYARKTHLEQTPVVKKGDRVKSGSLLTTSNYTDPDGRAALGRNLRVGYMGYQGKNFEDAIVISQSAANKLTSRHTYGEDYEPNTGESASRQKFMTLFPSVYSKEQLDKITAEGFAKPGTTVQKGDPIVLSVMTRDPSVTTLGRRLHQDKSMTWDHDEPGVVREVVKTKDGYRVYIEALHKMQIGDKLAASFGNKGVISEIIPDAEMVKDNEGKPLDIILSSKGLISRTNPAQVNAALLGKIAAKTNTRYILPGSFSENAAEFVEKELAENGIPDTEDLFDPRSNKTIPQVMTGVLHFYKMQQMSEAKGHARDTGGYSEDESPSRGGNSSSSKHIGDMEYSALLAHGVSNVLRDLKTVHGQYNPELWRQIKLGGTPSIPKIPTVYDKFRSLIRASGVTLKEDTRQGDSVFASTDAEVRELTKDHQITSPETYDRKMRPIPGGLFDSRATNSESTGDRFSYIALPEPMLNPHMEGMARSILGLRIADLNDLVAGRTEIEGKRGGAALRTLLERVDLDKTINEARDILKSEGMVSKKDAAAKRLMYAEALKAQNKRPEDFMMTRVPVLPPKFRRIVQQDDRLVVPDLNYLYRRLMNSIEDFKESDILGPDLKAEAREDMMHSYRALIGTEEPKDKDLQARRVGGVIQQLLGKGSPKYSSVQRKVLGANIDMSALGVVSVNPRFKLNEVGIPEDYAWTLFGPFVIRRLVEQGRPATVAAEAVKRQDPSIRDTLAEVMKTRPVLLNRAPTLHKYGIMALNAIPIPGKTIQVNPQLQGPYGADNDGNCLDFDEVVNLRISKSLLESDPIWRYLFDRSVLANTIKGDTAMFTEDMLATMKTDVGIQIRIGEFPRQGTPTKDKNGADVYEVPEGVSVLSYDSETGAPVFKPVTKFTEEKQADCAKVKIGSIPIIVSSNESLSVFDHKTGMLRKCAPAEAIGTFVPRVCSYPDSFGDYGTFDFGWWVGVFLADGWVTERTVGHSKLDEDIRNRFVDVTKSLFQGEYSIKEYSRPSKNASFGKAVKIHFNSKELADVVSSFGFYSADRTKYPEKRPALFKQIPQAMLARGSEEFLWGMLSGFVDGDCSMNINTHLPQERFYLRFNTSSKWLRDGLVSLMARLGIPASWTTAPARNKSEESYTLLPSIPYMHKHLDKIKCARKETSLFLEKWKTREYKDAADGSDIIPLTLEEMQILSEVCLSEKDMNGYSSVRKYKTAPRSHRATLKKLLTYLPEDCLVELRGRVSNLVRWDPVVSVENVGKRDVYDIEVEGTKVFVTTGGLVVYDTMSFTIPVSRNAVKEAYARMLPERHLISYGSGKPHYMPTQEPLEALYIMTKDPKSGKPVRRFASVADMKEAYRKGEIDADDPVRIAA